MPNTTPVAPAFDYFMEGLAALQEATDLTKKQKAEQLASQIDRVCQGEEGISFLYEHALEVESAGFFMDTAWQDPAKLVPSLVKGTLKGGHPSSSYEVISELRMLALANEAAHSERISPQEARSYLEEVITLNLEFAFREPTEESRLVMSERELEKAFLLFEFLLNSMPIAGIKKNLLNEILLVTAQRPVATRKVREMIHLVKDRIDRSSTDPSDKELVLIVDAVYQPTKGSKGKSLDEYQHFLVKASDQVLLAEAEVMGNGMRKFGLVSNFHPILLQAAAKRNLRTAVILGLALNARGTAECQHHYEYVKNIINEVLHPYNSQCIYGLSRMLDRHLFSRRSVRIGLENLRASKLHPEVEKRILKSIAVPQNDISAMQYLVGATLRVLGQPLGIGQGNNPTCQSARGISMWSQHAPAKLLNLIITASTQNTLQFRFEDQLIDAQKLGKGLFENLDYNLDAVSVVLVPLLDKLYNEMMRRASGRMEDPHKWVNPALYGQWIQVGFASAYNYLSNSIHDFAGFSRLFLAGIHPLYNEGHQLIYPNPVGIIITNAHGEMVGFHAVSLLRIDRDPAGTYRAYFLNPNNEGRQEWGQGISPSVKGNGERHGESSLPVNQFVSRLYAFHYNDVHAKTCLDQVPENMVEEIESMAESSWGRSYVWSKTPRTW